MIDFLIDQSLATGLLVFVFGIAAFSIAIYFSFRFIFKDYYEKKHERIGRVLFRVSASLLALILSITFANQRVEYYKLKGSLESEASKLVDIHLDLELYNTEQTKEMQSKIRDYILYISEDGWKSLHEDPFESRPFKLFRELYLEILNLETTNPLQERLKNNLIYNVDLVFDYLQVRLYSTRPEANQLIYTSIFGLAIIMMLFTVYSPDRITIGFLFLYVAFVGIVLYFILMMSNPLQGPLQLEPGPFLLLKETIEAHF